MVAIVGKKGYMKTLEAVFAVILLLIVIISVIASDRVKSNSTPGEINLLHVGILEGIQKDEELREMIYSFNENEDAIRLFVESRLDESRLRYDIQVCDDLSFCQVLESTIGQSKNIYSDSIIIYDSSEKINYLVRLYLWYNT